MKRFRFPLRPVAVLRAHQEVRAREVFAAAVHACVQAEEELARTRVRMRALEAALFSGRKETFRAAEAALLLSDYRRECAAEGEMERRVIAARDEMQKRRTDYVEAHRKVEVVQRLETKARTSHRLENDRAEQAEFDDYASRRRTKPFSLAL
ncbi:MAG TPA: flagellar FliJ family protein [Opitutus sp.]|nr:flagellar FliJ family protein [Opitutus sp.]